MLPVLQVGPLALQTPGLILLLGVWLGLEAAERQARFYPIPGGKIYNLALVMLLAGLLGARIFYILQTPAAFFRAPLGMLSLSPQMLDPLGGLVAAALAGLAAGQRQKLPFWPTLDALTGAFAVLAVAIGLAHLASGDAYGAPANLPWAINAWGAQRHPSQAYEILAALIMLGLLWPFPGSRLWNWMVALPGARFWAFVSLSAAARLFLEAFRGDSALLFTHLRAAQLIAWLALAIGLWQLYTRMYRSKE
jgi:prolipoprotein diacylglyceryltransferase